MSKDEFPAEDFRHVSATIRKAVDLNNAPILQNVLFNNLNVILAALDVATTSVERNEP